MTDMWLMANGETKRLAFKLDFKDGLDFKLQFFVGEHIESM